MKRTWSFASRTMSAARLCADVMITFAWLCASASRRSASRINALARSSCTGSIDLSDCSCSRKSSRSILTAVGEKIEPFASLSMRSIASIASYTVVNSACSCAGVAPPSSAWFSRRSGRSSIENRRRGAGAAGSVPVVWASGSGCGSVMSVMSVLLLASLWPRFTAVPPWPAVRRAARCTAWGSRSRAPCRSHRRRGAPRL